MGQVSSVHRTAPPTTSGGRATPVGASTRAWALVVVASCALLGTALPSAAAQGTATQSASPALSQAAQAWPASRFEPLPPARVLDTRSGVGAPAGRPDRGASLPLQMAGRGGVPPTGATAVALNLAVTDAPGAGYVQALPAGSGAIGASANVNVTGPGQTVANLAVVPLGDGGAITLYDVAGGHLVADVLGYFTPAETSSAGRYVPVRPGRLVDTRSGARPTSGGSFALPVTGRAGIPATGVSAVAMTVTATGSTGPGFVQVVPAGGATPLGSTSNVNVTGPGQTVANLVLVPVGNDGAVVVHTATATDVVVDVAGYVTDGTAAPSADGLFVGLPPARLSDSRASAPLAPGTTTSAPLGRAGLPATGVAAVMANVVAVGTRGPGFVQLFPTGHGTPGASTNVNFTAPGQTVAAAAVVQLGTGGRIGTYTTTTTDVVLDVSGYFTGSSAGTPEPHALASFGQGVEGQLGTGDRPTHVAEPAPVASGNAWTSVSAGYWHSAAVREDGTLWTWGDNMWGQLGDGTLVDRPAPVQVGTDANWVAVAAGASHTLALKRDGSLWGWGLNGAGEVGDGSTTQRLAPVAVAPGRTWHAVTAGMSLSAAIADDGTLWTWGNNSHGQLGDGTDRRRAVPGRVGTDQTWTAVDVGTDHVAALRADGSVWTWGTNVWGELGDGSTPGHGVVSRVPVRVASDQRFVGISAGWQVTSGVTADGALWTWGLESHRGREVAHPAPRRLGTSDDWVTVAEGWEWHAAVRADGTLWQWGRWADAQGRELWRSEPEQVGAAVSWSAVSSSYRHGVMLHD
ncbi:hypothetical protein ICW40_01610 [Actinotalea ferrariae]|uniref:hypothetical protein n=1 Tax=Actinotalea ferrariae TaxID=1386098 RepID=UPI001C8CA163|nr:hypothetical protein [Actinotalea ferrariae]MBX9243501.1 hypothetical protein [Actinotalea ferrariae]